MICTSNATIYFVFLSGNLTENLLLISYLNLMIQLFEHAKDNRSRIAVVDETGTYTYRDLLVHSESVAAKLLTGREDLQEARIAFLTDPGFRYVAIQWGIWRAGGIAVPLCTKHPYASISYVIEDTGAAAVIYSDTYATLLNPLEEDFKIRMISDEQIHTTRTELPDVSADRSAMILYTSGTTGQPKGVVTTHKNIEAQIKALVRAWKWVETDHILNILPLHHVHGIINVLSCALWSGACCQFLQKFDAGKVLAKLGEGEVNVFMAVPTIYYKLINHYQSLSREEQIAISNRLKDFRLMVSGSAALPVSTLNRWIEISGQTLLERYGMTEIGMAISNPYEGERRPGYIGKPLDSVNARIVNEDNDPLDAGQVGEIQIQGPSVFKEYWRRPEATKDAFIDGWFKTGDVAVVEDGYFRILGRNSVDIIKSGGYKISALEIEEVLRKHPKIKDCGVVGIPDEEWGEIIGASLVMNEGTVEITELKTWLSDKLPKYKIPRRYLVQDDLPRNVMGKVTKKELQKIFSTS